jgi:hypothetical protein
MITLLFTGCASIGPPTITRDRFDYITALSDSWKRQTLLNLLKIRYADAPVFMDVASVISSYSVEGELSLEASYAPPDRGDTYGLVGATGRYTDKPTITYQPLSGEKFAKNLMAAIPVTSILFLIQSGYPADLVLRICVNTINGLDNAYGGSGNPRPGSQKFRDLMTALRESQNAGGSGLRIKTVKNAQTTVMFFPPLKPEAAAPNTRIRELLGLDKTAREFNVVSGAFPENDQEIAIMTRSMLQVLVDFSSYIDVPAADIAEKRVYQPHRTPEQERMFPKLITVRNSNTRPDDTYVAVRYRNQWFWIDDRDQESKSILGFLMFMFSLTEGAPSQGAPVVTVPAR